MSGTDENHKPEIAHQRLISLCETIKAWWEEHKHDTAGDYGEWSVYYDDPSFVKQAKEVIGDWEPQD